MVALKTQFDGEKIVTPEELMGAAPVEVIVVVQDVARARAQRPSIFDAIGKAARPRSAEDIDAQVREERDSWGTR